MNANYSEALEQHAAVLHACRQLDLGDSDCRKILAVGETYFLSKELGELLATSGRGLLDWRLAYEDLPAPFGFLWLEQGWKTEGLFVENEEGIVSAASWGWFADDNGQFLRMWLFANHSQHATPYPERYWEIAEHQSIREWRGSDLEPCIDLQITQLLACFWQFVRQEIVTVAHLHKVERHARKRLERAGWQREPVVRIIKLRRTHAVQGGADRSRVSNEWSCQWLVRGHWRQQFYPSKHQNQPIWITPYVKGPDDKPLKLPRATVFAVVR